MIHSKWTNSDAWVQRFRAGKEGWGDKPSIPYCLPGSWGSEWVKGLEPAQEDFVVTKHRYSGFVNTDLDLVLRTLKRKTVVVTGGETNLCLATTAMGALMHDYYVILPQDCIAGIEEKFHQHGLRILDKFCGILTDSNEIIHIWKNQKKP